MPVDAKSAIDAFLQQDPEEGLAVNAPEANSYSSCKEELAGCIFVQNVEAPAVSILTLILVPGPKNPQRTSGLSTYEEHHYDERPEGSCEESCQ